MSNYYSDGLSYGHLVSVTASDTTELSIRGFMVGVSGDVAIQSDSMSAAVTMVSCLSGVIYPVGCVGIKIMSTNTTATSIVGFR